MDKISIGVMTMYRENYGAFLQAYALQKKLQDLGYSAEVIDYDSRKEHALLGIPLEYAKTPVFFIKRILIEILLYKKHAKRREYFQNSIKNNLVESAQKYMSYKHICQNPPVYDIYLTGSDQVFNPRLEPQSYNSRLLNFTYGVKVSYAASAGNIETLVGKEGALLKSLEGFSSISVREEQLQEFLSQRVSNVVYKNIDPTLLLNINQWKEFAKIPDYLKGKYIFYYRVLPQPELQKTAISLSDKLGIPIFAADGNTKFRNQITRQNYLSPEEWVGALMNAEYVVTNSFHGMAFSVNFKKKVRVVLPPSNKSRIQDLIEKNDLQRLYKKKPLQNEELDDLYKASIEFYATERKKAEEYLLSFSNILDVKKRGIL